MPDRRVLVVAPHPDDETLGVGGTIAALSDRGADVTVAIVTRCAVDRYGDDPDPTQRRREEAARAAKILGVSRLFFAEFKEVHLAVTPLPQIVGWLSSITGEVRPETIYIPHWADLNQDHRVVSEAALVVGRPYANRSIRTVMAYPVDPFGYPVGIRPSFNVFTPIAKTFGRKLEALGAYQSEIKTCPHPRSIAAQEGWARWWGAVSGVEVAEPFELVWSSGSL